MIWFVALGSLAVAAAVWGILIERQLFVIRRQTLAVLLRGTEGEPVADPRRCPLIEGLQQGQRLVLQPAQEGSLATLPDLPNGQDIQATAEYTQAVLTGQQPVPEPLRVQVQRIATLARTSLG